MTVMVPSSDLALMRASLLGRLRRLGREVRGQLLLEGVARIVAMLVGMGLLLFLLDHSLRLSAGGRVVLLVICAIAVGVEVWRDVVRPLRLALDPLTLAASVEARQDKSRSILARVATVLEMPGWAETGSGASEAMVRQAVVRSHAALAEVDFGGRVDARRRRGAAAVVVGAGLVAAIVWVVWPAYVGLTARRYFELSNEPWPQRTYLDVGGLTDGAIVVPRGEPFALRVRARAASEVPASITVRYREGRGDRVTASLTRYTANDFRYDFPGAQEAVSVELWGGDDAIGPFVLRPVDRPRIVNLQLISQHPTEAKPQVHNFGGDDSDLAFLPETDLQLVLQANTPIAEAHLTSATTRPFGGAFVRKDDRRLVAHWTHRAAEQLQIELVSADARLSSVPTELAIGLKVDHPPRVTLSYTGVRPRVTPGATIPLSIEARDDYGVTAAGLSRGIESGSPTDVPHVAESAVSLYASTQPAAELLVQRAYSMQLSTLKLVPGNVLTLAAVATDNCYAGAQTSRSRQVVFRIVEPEELFREILLRQQAERAKFRKQVDEARLLRAALNTLGTADAIGRVDHQHRAVQREVARIAASLAATVTEMRLNALGTEETYGLMDRNVIKPLEALDADLMTPQKDALDAMRPETVATSLADIQGRQDQIVSQMEEILKQMSQWDSFVDVLNQLNEIIQLQQGVEQQTEKAKKKQTEGVFEP